MIERHYSAIRSPVKLGIYAIICLSIAAVASLLFTSIALAQDDELTLEEIVVTARYRQENLQEVPLSETVFSKQLISDARIDQVGDFLALTPNVTFVPEADFGGSFITIRGISQV